LASSAKLAQNGGEQNAFGGLFVAKTTRRLSHFPGPISVKFEHKNSF